MKLIEVMQHPTNWDITEFDNVAQWAEEMLDKGDYIRISSKNIIMLEQDIAKYNLKYDLDLVFSIFENNGEYTSWSRELEDIG